MINIYVYKDLTKKKYCYVGQTKKTLEERAGENGKFYRNSLFGKAIKKEGWDNFEGKILLTVETSKEAFFWERFYIDKFNTGHPNGYNEVLNKSSGDVEIYNDTPYNLNMNTYWAYTRVSTDTQGQKESSLIIQENYLKERAKFHNMNCIIKREIQSAGALEKRDVLVQIIKNIKPGDILGVCDDSRLSRNTGDSIKIATTLANVGAKLEIAGKFVDVKDPTDEFTYIINSAVAQFQRKLQNAKAQASMDLQRANGNLSTTKVYGYDQYRSKGKHIAIINKEEGTNVKLVFEKFLNGDSLTKISKDLNISSWVVTTIVNNPLYAGYYMDTVQNTKIRKDLSDDEFKKHLKSNIYPPIIDFDTFMKVRAHFRLNHKIRDYSFRNSTHELTGIYRCACCGSGFVHVKMYLHGRQEGMVYNYYQNTFPHKGCVNHKKINFRAEKLEGITRIFLILALKAGVEVAGFFAETRNNLLQNTQDLIEKNDSLKQQIDEKKAKITRIKSLILDGTIDPADFKEDMTSLKAEISALEKSIDENNRIIDYKNRMIEDVLEEEANDNLDVFLNSNEEGRRDFYKRFVENGIIYNINKLTIEFINTKKFEYDNGSFKMSYLGQEQATGIIKDGKVSFNPVETPDKETTEYLCTYYQKLAEEVNGFCEVSNCQP